MKKIGLFIVCGILLLSLASCTQTPTQNTPLIGNSVFVTENISRITFYRYHGAGVGSEVPNEYMPEIIAWLDSFKIGREVTEEIPPGTGFYDVKIEYSDGTVISEGLDIVTIDGISYWLERENYPDCFYEIIEKCSLE